MDGRSGAAAEDSTGAAVVLRVLRVSLHVGFAVLLLVALARLLAGGIRGAGWLSLGLVLCLAGVYLAGTVLETRHSVRPGSFDPRPYSRWWLAAVCLLWLLLVWGSADFVWLAFPLFFLQLHLLPRGPALAAIAASTLLVVTALWFLNGGPGSAMQLPMLLGPGFGAAFAVVTGLVAARQYAEEEGFLSLGDTFLAIGTMVVLVEAVFFAATGLWVGLAYGVAGVALTLFALKQDRQTAVAVAAIMSLFVGTWMYSDPSALLLGLTPSALWVLGALAYTSSLRSGESLALE